MNINASLDSMMIHKMYINGCNFSNIIAIGDITDNVADLRLVSKNEATPALFQGVVKLGKNLSFDNAKAYLNIPQLDLVEMSTLQILII